MTWRDHLTPIERTVLAAIEVRQAQRITDSARDHQARTLIYDRCRKRDRAVRPLDGSAAA